MFCSATGSSGSPWWEPLSRPAGPAIFGSTSSPGSSPPAAGSGWNASPPSRLSPWRGILTWAGWTLVALEQEAKTALALGVPTWAAQAILPLEFLIITFRLGLLAAGEPLEAAEDKEGSS